MSTMTASAPVVAPALPDLDPAQGDALGDDILLGVVASTKVARVRGGDARAESRAWSFGGNVD